MPIAIDNVFWPDPSGLYPLRTRARMIADAGYDGMSCNAWMYHGREPFWEQVGAFAGWGCPLRSVYMSIPAGTAPGDQPEQWVRDALDRLPEGAHLELALSGPLDDPGAGDQMRGLLSRLADHAANRDRRIALYPHTGYWLSSTREAVRWCSDLGHPALRLCFPGSHWLAVSGLGLDGGIGDPGPAIAAMAPMLISANLCGSRRESGHWRNCLLDAGDLDVVPQLAALRRSGFAGPLTVQFWQAAGDPWTALVRNRTWLEAAEARVSRLLQPVA